MNTELIHTYLPTGHQKIAAGVLAIIAAAWLLRLLKRGLLREEHAILWLLALVCLSAAVFFDPVLTIISSLLGTVVPASALLLLGMFFLFTICVWMTCIISGHERQIAHLSMELSIQRFMLENKSDGGESDLMKPKV